MLETGTPIWLKVRNCISSYLVRSNPSVIYDGRKPQAQRRSYLASLRRRANP